MTNITPLDFDPNRRDPERRAHLRGVPKETAPATERYVGIGTEFAGARNNLGLDMGHVAAVLRIRREHLTAIEDGRFGDLPAPAYALGFVRSYADYLGMDPTAAVEAFKAETNQKRDHSPLVFPTAETADRVPRGWLLGMSAFLAAVVFGAWFYSERAGNVGIERVPPPPVAAASDSALAPRPLIDNAFANTDVRRPVEPVAVAPVAVAAAPVAVPAAPPTPPVAAPATPGALENALNKVLGLFQGTPANVTPPDAVAPAPARAPAAAVTPPGPAATPAPELPAAAPAAAVDPAPAPEAAAIAGPAPAPAEPAAPVVAEVQAATPAVTPPAEALLPVVIAAAPTPAPAAPVEVTPVVPAVPTPPVTVAAATPVTPPAPAPVVQAAPPAIPPAAPAELAALPGGQTYGAVGTNARVVILATQDSWVQITGAAGELLLTRILRAGDKYLAPSRDDLVMMTGNAGAIDVLVDGRLIPALGPAGSVRRNVSLMPEKLLNGTAVAP